MLALIFDIYLVENELSTSDWPKVPLPQGKFNQCVSFTVMWPINLLNVITSLHRLKYVSQALQSHCALFLIKDVYQTPPNKLLRKQIVLKCRFSSLWTRWLKRRSAFFFAVCLCSCYFHEGIYTEVRQADKNPAISVVLMGGFEVFCTADITAACRWIWDWLCSAACST